MTETVEHLKISAHFMAFLECKNRNPEATLLEVVGFADENWHGFMGVAIEELGEIFSCRYRTAEDKLKFLERVYSYDGDEYEDAMGDE